MKNTKILLIITIIIAFIILIVSFKNIQKQETRELTEITVAHWGHSKILIYLPLYVGIDGGFFEKYGLNVKIKYSGNDDQVYATVLSGDAQFGVGDPAFTVVAGERGGKGKIIATLVSGLANWGVAKKDRFNNITDFKELEGIKISSFPSPSTTYTILTEIIKENNLINTKIVETPFGNELALLQKDDVDLAIMLEPNASIAVNQGYVVIFNLAKLYGPYLLTGVTSSDKFINENIEIVNKFYNAIDEAIIFCHANPDSTIRIAQMNFPDIEENVITNAIHRMMDDNVIPESAIIDSIAYQNLLNTRIVAGDIKSNGKFTQFLWNKNKQ